MFKISYEDFKGDVAVNFESVCVREHEFDIVLTDRVPSERFNYAFNDLAKYSVRKNGNDVCCFDIYEPITEDQAEVLPICDQNDAVFGVLLDLENTFSLLDMSVLKAVIEFVRETYGTFSMAPVIGQEAEFISCISDDGCDGFLPSHMVDDDPDNIALDHFYCDYLIQYGM